jgi:hypothetical protein
MSMALSASDGSALGGEAGGSLLAETIGAIAVAPPVGKRSMASDSLNRWNFSDCLIP